MQLVYQEEENIELADGSKTRRDLAQPASELSGGATIELKHRQQLAHLTGRHTGLVERPHIALFDRAERATELIDAFFEQFRTGRGNGHDVWGPGSRSLHYSRHRSFHLSAFGATSLQRRVTDEAESRTTPKLRTEPTSWQRLADS